MFNALIDFVFPKLSIISGERLPDENSNQYISDTEINLISRVTDADLVNLSEKVMSDYSFSVFAFREKDDFSKIIYELKYGGMKRLGVYLGELLGDSLKNYFEEINIGEFELIIPVPLHKTKLRERGYNQSDYICKGIKNKLNIKVFTDLVKRVRHTSTQTKLSREERIKNMKDAFEINEKYKHVIEGRKIIVVDDVVTTGSTINEVVKVLRFNGCGDLLACVLAMAR